MNDMDKVLKKVLSPTEYPSEKLNEKVINQMKMKVKECDEMRIRNRRLIAAVVVICIFLIPVSAYAAYKYLLPKQVAKEMDDRQLEEAFDKKGTEVLQTVTDDTYKVTYLGHVTGESLSDRTGSAWELNPDRIYVAVAIEKADGTAVQNEEGSNIFVSPLIQGLAPWTYNIVTMNGSYMEKVIDGILYRIIECDNIEVFADKKLYLAVSNTMFFSNEAYQYDEATGDITAKEEYEKTNVLFDLVLDTSKADPVKAKEYLDRLDKEWNSDSVSGDNENTSVEGEAKDTMAEESSREQQELFTDEENGITIRIKDNNSHRWSAGYDYSHTILQYYLEVEGDNIESLTYTLNQGEFCNYPEHNLGEAEYYGNECSLSYGEQKDRNYLYSVSIKGKYEDYGYDAEEVSKLGYTDADARDKIYYDVLNKAISDTKMSIKIIMKDGREIAKTLTFKNVSDYIKSFWITISVD
jgi:hypothetical protein